MFFFIGVQDLLCIMALRDATAQDFEKVKEDMRKEFGVETTSDFVEWESFICYIEGAPSDPL